MTGKKIQHMPPEGGNICDGCKRLVRFKLLTSKPCKDWPGRRVAYLQCPLCGHRATQIRWQRRTKKPRKRGD